jgi:hypothetical protein
MGTVVQEVQRAYSRTLGVNEKRFRDEFIVVARPTLCSAFHKLPTGKIRVFIREGVAFVIRRSCDDSIGSKTVRLTLSHIVIQRNLRAESAETLRTRK